MHQTGTCSRAARRAHRSPSSILAQRARSVGLAAALVMAGACGTSSGPSPSSFVCASAYGSSCGAECSTDAPCPLGLRCVTGACSADCSPSEGCGQGETCSLAGICGPANGADASTPCTPDDKCPQGFLCQGLACGPACGAAHPCPAGYACSASGSCISGVLLGDAALAGDLDAPSGSVSDACVKLEVTFDKKTPTVVLLVDQSSSMDEPVGDAGETRWTLLRSAVLSPTGVVATLQDEVEFGLTLYSSDNGDGTCPQLTKVPVAPHNYDAIESAYEAASPVVNTPTGPAILDAVQDLSPDAGAGPRYILLVTDGLPDTCSDRNPADGLSQEAANRATVQAAEQAYGAGVGLFIIGVSSDIAPVHLQQMANAGAGLAPETLGSGAAPYWVAADDQAGLAAQIGAIVGAVRSCAFMLHGMVQSGYEAQGSVILDGQALGYGDPNGWKLDSPSELELVGSACDSVQSSTSKLLSVDFPCGGYVEIPH